MRAKRAGGFDSETHWQIPFAVLPGFCANQRHIGDFSTALGEEGEFEVGRAQTWHRFTQLGKNNIQKENQF